MDMKKDFMTLEEACEYLGIKKATMYYYTHNRKIAFYKPMRKLYFKIDDLNTFLFSQANYHKAKT